MNEKTGALLTSLNGHFKRTVITTADKMPAIPRISTRIPAVDYCMTGGGVPLNRMIELYGPESSGKTYLAQIMMREFQNFDWNNRVPNGLEVTGWKTKHLKFKNADKTEGTMDIEVPTYISTCGYKNPRAKNVVIIDAEGTWDTDWATKLGIDNRRIIRIVPETGENAVDIAEVFIRDPDTCLIVIDSVAAIKPKAEIEKSMDDQNMGVQARFWNRAMGKFQAAMNGNPEADITIVLINRAYTKIGLVFGDPEEIGNGSGIKFAKSISLKCTQVGKPVKTEDGDVVGRTVKVENKKNKTGAPFRSAQYFFALADDEEKGIKYGETDIINDTIELGCVTGIIAKAAGNYTFGRLKIKGRENFENFLRENPEKLDVIISRIMEL